MGSRAVEGTHHPGQPSPCWDPPFGAPCQTNLAPRSAAVPWLHRHPHPHPYPGDCVGFWGQSSFFWRLPDNSALYLPPVPPNTLVSAAALCCKFPWSNYVLIYDNPRAGGGGGQTPVKFGSCPPGPEGPPWLLATVNSTLDRELLHPGGCGERSIPELGVVPEG